MLPRSAATRGGARRRNRPAVSEDSAPRRRLQPRCVYQGALQSHAHVRWFRRDPRYHTGGETEPGRVAESQGRAGGAVRRPARSLGCDPEHLHDYIAEFLQVVNRHGTKAGVYAHASVGCLHVRPVINLKTASGVQQFEAIANDVADLVLQYGGAISGEHGDGLVRSPFQEKMYGPALYAAFREIKQTFDPLNLFNPGKIVDAPPLTSNLRYGASYVTPEVPTTFDFSA